MQTVNMEQKLPVAFLDIVYQVLWYATLPPKGILCKYFVNVYSWARK